MQQETTHIIYKLKQDPGQKKKKKKLLCNIFFFQNHLPKFIPQKRASLSRLHKRRNGKKKWVHSSGSQTPM